MLGWTPCTGRPHGDAVTWAPARPREKGEAASERLVSERASGEGGGSLYGCVRAFEGFQEARGMGGPPATRPSLNRWVGMPRPSGTVRMCEGLCLRLCARACVVVAVVVVAVVCARMCGCGGFGFVGGVIGGIHVIIKK